MRSVFFLCLLASLTVPAFAGDPKPMFDLSKVAGMNNYTGPPEGKKLLAQYGLVITNETTRRLYQQYEALPTDSSRALPCFVTTDAAVRAFADLLEEAFKKLEVHQARALKGLLARMWSGLVAGAGWGGLLGSEIEVKGAAREGAALFAAVAIRLLDPKWKPKTAAGKALLDRVAGKVQDELKRIAAEKIVLNAPLFGCDTDYTLCRPRSFYAGEKLLQRYYRARTFLGFPMNLDDDSVLPAALGMACFVGAGDFLYPYKVLLGPPDLMQPSILAGRPISVSGQKPLFLSALAGKDPDALRELLRKADYTRPKLPVFVSRRDAAARAKRPPLLTAMVPKIATPDSIMMTRCVVPYVKGRFLPSGLDVLACCGDKRAESHVLAAASGDLRKGLKSAFHGASQNRASIPGDSESAELFDFLSVFGRWTRVFDSLSSPELTKQHPKFMTTTAYADKALNTAISGWAAYRHTIQLQAEEPSGLFGGPGLPPPGYVEPNLPFWDTMIEVTLDAQIMFSKYGAPAGRLALLTKMCLMAKEVAAAQLAGRPLTRKQRLWLGGVGEILPGIADASLGTIAEDQSFVGTVWSERDRQVALHVGVARPRAIYVIVDYGGELVLARGGVMSYREFWHPISKGRLTDQQWRRMLSKGTAPGPPKWVARICVGKDKPDRQEDEKTPDPPGKDEDGKP